FAPDGKRFFVTVGAAGNLDEEAPPRASVQSFAADGSDQRSFATGLRNPVGISFRPGSDDLYVVVNERDGMGDGLVPDFLTRLQGRAGALQGWKACGLLREFPDRLLGRRPFARPGLGPAGGSRRGDRRQPLGERRRQRQRLARQLQKALKAA